MMNPEHPSYEIIRAGQVEEHFCPGIGLLWLRISEPPFALSISAKDQSCLEWGFLISGVEQIGTILGLQMKLDTFDFGIDQRRFQQCTTCTYWLDGFDLVGIYLEFLRSIISILSIFTFAHSSVFTILVVLPVFLLVLSILLVLLPSLLVRILGDGSELLHQLVQETLELVPELLVWAILLEKGYHEYMFLRAGVRIHII